MSAASINRVVLEGELLEDPALVGGRCILRLLVVTPRRDPETKAWVGRPNPFEVVVWGTQGEVCAAELRRGRPVGIDGHLAWEQSLLSDGGRRQTVEIVADNVRFLDMRVVVGPQGPAQDPATDAADTGDGADAGEAAAAA